MTMIKKLIIATVSVVAFGPGMNVFAMDVNGEEETKEGAAAAEALAQATMPPEEVAEAARLAQFRYGITGQVGVFLPTVLSNLAAEYAMPTSEEVEIANKNLLKAAEEYDLETVTRALSTGANIDWILPSSSSESSPLHWAVHWASSKTDHFTLLKTLLDRKANVNVKGWQGYTPLYWAIHEDEGAERRDFETVKTLIDYNAHTEIVASNGRTPLLHALNWGTPDTVKLLIERGADVHAVDKYSGANALHIAVQFRIDANHLSYRDFTEVVKILLNRGLNINAVANLIGDTVLHHAVAGNNIKIVELLLERKATINQVNGAGESPLHQAARFDVASGNNDKVMRALILAGANTNQMNNDDLTPFDVARQYGREEKLRAMCMEMRELAEWEFIASKEVQAGDGSD